MGANLQGKQHILDAGNVVKLLCENTPHTVEKVGSTKSDCGCIYIIVCKSASLLQARLLLILHMQGTLCSRNTLLLLYHTSKLQTHAY